MPSMFLDIMKNKKRCKHQLYTTQAHDDAEKSQVTAIIHNHIIITILLTNDFITKDWNRQSAFSLDIHDNVFQFMKIFILLFKY